MKKIMILALAALLMAAMMIVPVSAASGVAEVTGTTEAMPGNQLEVVLYISGYSSVTALGIEYTVPEGLRVDSAQWLMEGLLTDAKADQAAWLSSTPVDLTQKTAVFKFTLTVLDLPKGQTNASLDVDFTKITVHENKQNVYPEPVKATITVTGVAGDMNGDGAVNDADAIYLLRHTMLPTRYPLSGEGDVNGDDVLNDADAVYLLRHTMLPTRYPLYPNK